MIYLCSVKNSHQPDSDPAFNFDDDQDPSFHFDEDPETASRNDAEPLGFKS
jgi:hypothetical protein